MKNERPRNQATLRRKAGERLKQRTGLVDRLSAMDARRLVTELGTHKLELEMQNEELRTAQIRLEESNRKYFALFNLAPVGYLTLDGKGMIIQANLTAAEQFGIARSGLIRRAFHLLIAAGDRDLFLERRRRAVETGERQRCEAALLRKSGEPFFARIEIAVMDGEDGSPDQCLVTLTDITGLRKSEEALSRARSGLEERIREKTSELTAAYNELKGLKERLVRTLESIGDGFFTLDRQWRFTYVNAEAARFFEMSRGELIGKRLWDISPKARGTIFEEQYRRALEEQSSVGFEAFSPLRNSWVEVRATPYADGISVHFADITKRKHADEDLARLAAVVESAVDAVVITDPDQGGIQYVNTAFEQVTGYSRDEVVGRTLHFLDSGRHDEDFYRTMRESLARDGVWQGRLISRKKDGTLYYEDCTASVVRDAAGRIINFATIKRDVTDKLRLESIAEAVNSMESIGYVFSGLRHEIGNPVNSAKSILSVLQHKVASLPPERAAEYVGRALAEIGRVETLLQRFRTYNLYETPDIRPVDTASFLEDFMKLIAEDFASKGIRISRQAGPDTERIAADGRALQQALLNVVTNAADALAGRPDPRIDVMLFRKGDRVVIRVADNGCGMTEEQQRGLFKPFTTTKPRGTGLGLVIVKKLITRMNGEVGITSTAGEGTMVDISLKAADDGNG